MECNWFGSALLRNDEEGKGAAIGIVDTIAKISGMKLDGGKLAYASNGASSPYRACNVNMSPCKISYRNNY